MTTMETRTYWLSFCDNDRPEGQRFIGACIVQVTLSEALTALASRPDMRDRVEGPWIGAAVLKAWALGCNPGGEVASARVDDFPGNARRLACYPHGTLMTKDEIEAIDQQMEQQHE